MTSRQFFFPFLSIFFHEINENNERKNRIDRRIGNIDSRTRDRAVSSKINRRTLHIKLDENNN